MRVSVANKEEGAVLLRFEAESAVEATILAVCGMGEARASCTLHSEVPYDRAKPAEAIVQFDGFRIPVHTLVQAQRKA